MGSYGASELSGGVGGMMNGTCLTLGSVAGLGASGGGRTLGAEIGINNELVEVGGFFRR